MTSHFTHALLISKAIGWQSKVAQKQRVPRDRHAFVDLIACNKRLDRAGDQVSRATGHGVERMTSVWVPVNGTPSTTSGVLHFSRTVARVDRVIGTSLQILHIATIDLQAGCIDCRCRRPNKSTSSAVGVRDDLTSFSKSQDSLTMSARSCREKVICGPPLAYKGSNTGGIAPCIVAFSHMMLWPTHDAMASISIFRFLVYLVRQGEREHRSAAGPDHVLLSVHRIADGAAGVRATEIAAP